MQRLYHMSDRDVQRNEDDSWSFVPFKEQVTIHFEGNPTIPPEISHVMNSPSPKRFAL